jgi:hypothetical protein
VANGTLKLTNNAGGKIEIPVRDLSAERDGMKIGMFFSQAGIGSFLHLDSEEPVQTGSEVIRQLFASDLDHTVELTLYGGKYSFPMTAHDAERLMAGMDSYGHWLNQVEELKGRLSGAEACVADLKKSDRVSVGPTHAMVD